MPSQRPVFPNLIDTDQVSTSLAPRPMDVLDDDAREVAVEATGGTPLVDYEGRTNPYIDYQYIDVLLSLQQPRSDGYDEFFFIIVGQVKELLFRGLHFELHNARSLIGDDDVDNALVVLDRAGVIVDYITGSWDLLATITAEGFNQFRDHLSTASGQLSFMYRHVEFVLGNKNPELAAAHRNVPHVWPAIEEALNAPSLYDAAISLLARNGYPVGESALDRDWSLPYESNPSVADAWATVYDDPNPTNPLYRLAETLIALDEKVSHYRWRHFTGVHKTIGFKPGTGGSAGVGWLKHVTEHRFFPELWEIRNRF